MQMFEQNFKVDSKFLCRVNDSVLIPVFLNEKSFLYPSVSFQLKDALALKSVRCQKN